MNKQENKETKQNNIPQITKIDLIRELIDNCRYDDALEQLELLQEEEPDNFEVNYELARIYFELGDYNSAISNYEEVLLHQQSAIMYYNLGMAYEANDEVDKAISSYLKCITVNEKFSLANKKLGVLFMARGDMESAREFFEDYLKADIPEVEKEQVQKILDRI
ncbi:MAG: tetratricopeptide repeat protein [Cyanobacteria bacterium SIG30]|nr:tetratricopeptide repeat protein [Cyanobacteria bacterium SIG30]